MIRVSVVSGDVEDASDDGDDNIGSRSPRKLGTSLQLVTKFWCFASHFHFHHFYFESDTFYLVVHLSKIKILLCTHIAVAEDSLPFSEGHLSELYWLCIGFL